MAAGHLGTIWASVGLDVAPLGAGAARARRLMYATDATMSKHSNGIQHALMGIGKAGLVMGAVIAGASVKMAADFDKTAREVATLSNTTGAAFEQMKDDILDLSTTTEHGAKDLMQAYYWITSAMPGAEEAAKMDVLNASQALATAGVADMADTADLVTTTLNAWGLKTEDVTHVTDVLFEIVKRGKTTIGELAHHWSKAASSAALMEVPIEDLGASVATLTRVGIPADRALMAMNRTLLGLNKATPETQKWIKGLGYENAQMMMKSVGLPGFLKALAKDFGEVSSAEGQNAEAMAAMFPNIRELLALLPLTGKNLGDVIADFEAFTDTTGNVSDAVEIMSGSLSYQLSQMMNKVRKPLIELGEKLIPHVEKAMDAFIRIIEGKNEAFNTFARALKRVGTALWNVGKFIVDVKPLLYGLAAAFAAVKIAGFASSMVAATGAASGLVGLIGKSLPLSFILGQIGAGFVTLAAPIAAAAAVVGLFAYETWQADKKAEKAWGTIRELDEAHGKLGQTLEPLVKRYHELNAKVAEGVAPAEELAAADAELKTIRNEIAAQFPSLKVGLDEEGVAILKQDEDLNKLIDSLYRYSDAKKLTTTGEMGQLEIMLGDKAKLQAQVDEIDAAMSKVGQALQSIDAQGFDAGLVIMDLARDFGTGAKSIEAWRVHFEDLGDTETADKLNEIGLALGVIEGMGKGKNIGELRQQLEELGSAASQMATKLNEAAYQAGLAGGPMGEEFAANTIRGLNSASPEFKQAALNNLAAYLAGQLQARGVNVEESGVMAQEMANAFVSGGEWDSKGSKAGAEVMTNLQAELDGTQLVIPPIQSGGYDEAGWRATIARMKGELPDHWEIPVWIKEFKVNPTFRTPAEAAKYINKELSKNIGPVDTNINIGMTGGSIGGNASGAMDALTASWSTLLHAVNGFWDYMEGKDWEELNNQISKVLAYYPGAQASGLQAWWDLHGAMEAAEAELTKIDNAIKKHENAIEALTRTQRDLNDELAEYSEQLTDANDKIAEQQQALSRLGQLKIKGETAADEKSFDLQHKSNELQLAILKAEKEMNFEKAAMLTLQKEEVDKAKELHDLQTTVTYEEGRREIEQSLDLMHGEEAAQWKIVAGIEKAQGILKTQEGIRDSLNEKIELTNDKLKEITRQIRNEQDAVILLKIEFDNAKVHVDSFKQKIEDMSSYFLGQFNLMEQAARDLGITLDELIARQQAGGGGSGGSFKHGGPVLSGGQYTLHAGEFVLSKAMLQNMSPQLSPVITSGDTTVNVPVYLDSQKIAHATTRVTGANASRYARSGGRY